MKQLAGKLLGSARSLVCTPYHRLLNAIDPPVLVLVYHRVCALSSDPELLAVTPANFRAQMRYLKERVPLVRFEEDWRGAAKPAVAVTFDDGYADNALEALPILEELGVPATFFVATGAVGTDREYWWHELEQILLEGRKLPSCFALRDTRAGRSWPTATRPERQAFYSAMVQLMNGLEATRRNDWLAQIRRWAQLAEGSRGLHRAMTQDELRRLAASPLVAIGAHTVTHSRLASLPRDAQREEITRSREQLEEWTGREVATFAYPFGRRSDYTAESVALCRKSGFAKAASNFPGQAHRWTDPYQIPRHLVRNWPVQEFAARLEGFWTR